MRVTREQAAKTRRRIIKAAGRLFRQRGLEGVGVADIMQKVGLTHGGFYGHFASKADLAVEACTTALIENVAGFVPKDDHGDAEPLAAVIDAYLSPEHRKNAGNGCVFAALGSDAGRSPLPLRHAFAEGLQAYISAIAQTIPGRSMSEKRQKAVATMAGLVGAMVLARAVDDPSLSDEVLRATSTTLRSL